MFEQCLGNEGARVETNRAACDEVAATHGDEIGSAGPRPDEMDGHRPSPEARAQVARSLATRAPKSRALRPATTIADASAIDGSPLAASTSLEAVRTWPATRSRSSAVQATRRTESRRAASENAGSVAFSDSVAIAVSR